MRRSSAAALLALLAAPLTAQQRAPAPYDSVDPFVDTGGEGHTLPGAVAPFARD